MSKKRLFLVSVAIVFLIAVTLINNKEMPPQLLAKVNPLVAPLKIGNTQKEVALLKSIPPINQSKTPQNNTEVWVSSIQQWIDEFPFPQEETNSILGANPPEVIKALQKFNQKIQNEIVDNKQLSHAEKSRILWNVFSKTNWKGSDNALSGLIQDHLSQIAPFELSKEILEAYQALIYKGENSFEMRKSLLEVSYSILSLKENLSSLTRQEQQNYAQQAPYIKALLLQQIRANTGSDYNDLSMNAIEVYTQHSNKTEMEALIPEVQSSVNNLPDSGVFLYQSALTGIFYPPRDTGDSLKLLLESTASGMAQTSLNKTLVFLLKEDNNIVLAHIP